jgi:predicted nuclease with RNAse H fold
VLTCGVDLSSQASNTSACVIDWSDGRAMVTEITLGVTDGMISRLLQDVEKLGIDVPLGWPMSFARAVARHSEDGSWPADYTHADTSMYRFRRTDLWVWKTFGTSPPLSVSTDRIALPAMRAAALLSRLPERPRLDGSGVVVEVYPAATLRRWGFPWRGYKRHENSTSRRELVELVREKTASWLTIGRPGIDLCRSSDDALDALIAALAARAAAVGLAEPVPPDLRTAAIREGWISIPQPGSLDQLSLPTAESRTRIRVD